MRQILIEDSTFKGLAKLTQPLQGDTADTVIARLIKSYKRNGQAKAATRARVKALPGRGLGTPNGIGVRIEALIKKGWGNPRIYKAVKKSFPKSRIKGPASVAWYRHKMKRGLKK